MIHDIYYLSIVKFYYKLTNANLLDYFDHFKPKVSTACSRHPIRNPTIQYPTIRHEYARNTLYYQLIIVVDGSTNYVSFPVNVNNSILEKVATHSFIGCKIYAKNAIIELCQDLVASTLLALILLMSKNPYLSIFCMNIPQCKLHAFHNYTVF